MDQEDYYREYILTGRVFFDLHLLRRALSYRELRQHIGRGVSAGGSREERNKALLLVYDALWVVFGTIETA